MIVRYSIMVQADFGISSYYTDVETPVVPQLGWIVVVRGIDSGITHVRLNVPEPEGYPAIIVTLEPMNVSSKSMLTTAAKARIIESLDTWTLTNQITTRNADSK